MKEVKAYIKPYKLSAVTQALRKMKGITGVTVTEARGFGRGRAKDARDKIIKDFIDYVPCVRVEVICKDSLVNDVVNAIEKAAHTGLRGDGKIYVIPVEEAVRISTGERGEDAV